MRVLYCCRWVVLFLLVSSTFCVMGYSTVADQDVDLTSELNPHERGFNNALDSLRKRTESAPSLSQLSYKEQLKDNKGNQLIRYYDTTSPSGKRWRDVTVVGEDLSQSELQIDIPVVLSPLFVEWVTPVFRKESDRHWIFSINTSVNAESEDEQIEELEEATGKLQDNLETFIYVDKQTHRFTRLEISNSTPFKPSSLAKIDVFSVIVDYSEAWERGPVVAIKSIRKLKGSYGFFISIDEILEQELSQFSIKQ